ncbi:hypothetical protein HanRHA438_Chr08g0355561 [Helianthus annuus]|nr:hypothetical protein HanRHA438_Chr08g0355561 [Helianthus annuus]
MIHRHEILPCLPAKKICNVNITQVMLVTYKSCSIFNPYAMKVSQGKCYSLTRFLAISLIYPSSRHDLPYLL